MSVALAYITCKDMEEAERIGATIVEERLAACVNILPGMTSMYWWDGAIQKEHEVVMIAKTRMQIANRFIERVRELHSYEVPCVVLVPILKGTSNFIHWVEAEADPDSARS
ncbi:divalent-cation tolerance protein CutA [Desulfovibrio inopinatus]|uniref:divalent-cation tolerance protein CutA n=1 Tax=Desulfovibrio inopinatus TaxID=102109 RepID=UPI000427E1C0|nr:divalent-cation tolerance protein CutA [Desulfovibrio inopinatus]